MVAVAIAPSPGGWTATVSVTAGDTATEHVVTVSAAELERYGGGEPARLVRLSFDFLLQREPAGSILRRFALSDIERYFPDFPDAIRRSG